MTLSPGTQLGPYEIVAQLGSGGMGVVYEARDPRLKRTVAIKLLPPDLTKDDTARQRFLLEAQAASALNHPNICSLYDIGDQDGQTYLVMERLEGETLAETIAKGPLPVQVAVSHALVLLDTLEKLHERGLLHRDLKPANIFLTAHGLKLLDFGLARPATSDADETVMDLTQRGVLHGTPRYMAPEALRGETTDHRADLFAIGAVLYEMLAGTPAFQGSPIEAAHAVLTETPPALAGSEGIAVVDRTIHRALAKHVDQRYASAADMAADLRQIPERPGAETAAIVRPVTRLIVLPFRLLRPDTEVDFLAFSLADAVANALVGLESLVVRSAVLASKLGADPNLERVAAEAQVDVALMSTLLRAGDALRVSAQLVELPAGTVLWSHSMHVKLGDLFQVQDDLVDRIVDSLSSRLTVRDRQPLKKNVPASPTAYEYYLRATALSGQIQQFRVARDLYQQCVEEDPGYAPAWARLGRMYRVVGKFLDQTSRDGPEASYRRSEQAFERALELSPDLPVAHNLLTGLEVERGRAVDAVIRLLGQVKRGGADPEVFAGLVLSCRYCGLLEASLAADEQARRLDPNVASSVGFSLLLAGLYQRGVEAARTGVPDIVFKAECLLKLGRAGDVVEELKTGLALPGQMAWWCAGYLGIIQNDRPLAVDNFLRLFDQLPEDDPEASYMVGKALSWLGQPDRALAALEKGVARGYYPYPAFLLDPWLDRLRENTEFGRIVDLAHSRFRDARSAYVAAGGNQLLGTRLEKG